MIARALFLALVLAACNSDELDDVDHVRTWANTASAVAVWSHAHGPIAFADGEGPFRDPMCPTTADDGTTVTIEGGCTDAMGKRYVGSATIRRDGDDRTLMLDGYGAFDDPDLEATLTGTVTLVRMEDEPLAHLFDAELVHEGGLTTTVDYRGRIVGGYEGRVTFSGEGDIERDGLGQPTGEVHATTTDEVLDNDVCNGQAVSGRTSIEMDGHEAIVTYDGATDCDEDEAAQWSYDGEDRGRVDGVVCGIARAGGAPRSRIELSLFCLAVVALGWRRRRS